MSDFERIKVGTEEAESLAAFRRSKHLKGNLRRFLETAESSSGIRFCAHK